MNRRTTFIAILMCIAVCGWAQMPTQPGAEVKKLQYFVGTWTTECTIAQGPWGAGGKYSATGSTEWALGNYFLEGHREFQAPPEIGGGGKEASFLGYDTQQNVYTYDSFNSQGRRVSSKGTLIGDTWTWTSSVSYGGQDIQQRMTMKILSPASYSLKFEISMDGGTWATFMEGKATKK